MRETIKTEVILPNDEEAELEIECDEEENVVTLRLKGEEICCGDWGGNFRGVFKRALELW